VRAKGKHLADNTSFETLDPGEIIAEDLQVPEHGKDGVLSLARLKQLFQDNATLQ